MFNFVRSFNKKKIIYHTGAWAGNFGDSILEQSIQSNLSSASSFNLEFRYINCQQTEFTQELIKEINKKGDLLLIGGGGLIFYRPQDESKSGWQWNIDIDLIDQIKIPFVLYGVGYNQFEYDQTNFLPITNAHLQTTVSKAALFSVRNHGTKIQLVARGCEAEKIEVIPDSGMFLPPKDIEIPKLNKTKLKIGFNWTTDRESQTFPQPFPASREQFISACVELLNYAASEKNAQIFHVGHMGAEFDKDIIYKLKTGLIQSPIIIDEELPQIYPPSGENAGHLVDVYKQMDIVIGMRGHANIVSFGQNTPFIGIGSHRKIRYFLEDIRRTKFFFDVRPEGEIYSIDHMKDILNEIIDNYQAQKVQMMKELSRQKIIFDKFNKKVIALLEN